MRNARLQLTKSCIHKLKNHSNCLLRGRTYLNDVTQSLKFVKYCVKRRPSSIFLMFRIQGQKL
jgi:hypothetical protein